MHSGGMTNQEKQAERQKFWTELIARHKRSGKTIEAFCQENGVGGPSFYAWRKRRAEKGQPIGFALVTPASASKAVSRSS